VEVIGAEHISPSDAIAVLSSAVGERGGAAKATLLLCQALTQLGKQVTLFVTGIPDAGMRTALAKSKVTLVVPYVNRGWRVRAPHRCIAWQLFWWTRRNPNSIVHAVSLSPEARYFLALPGRASTYLWETTEALPDVKFVDLRVALYLQRARAILAPSCTIAQNIRTTYRYEGTIKILPFWVDSPETLLPLDARVPSGRLLYVGRLDLDKGFLYLFEAVRSVRNRRPGVQLVVRGEGAVEDLQALRNGDSGISIRGYASSEELEADIEWCDALVLPSLHEGYPLSLLDACARARPVIATSVGSIPEVFGGRTCALLVPPADAPALAGAIETLLSDDVLAYERRCRDARSLFEEVSAPDVIMKNLQDIYDS
jgi:glycosyltransferase involved in cell wall biosynthesis